jgi:MinD superfamily P-loop ATPase
MEINQQACLGCGFCAMHCPKEAIDLQLREPFLGTVLEYCIKNGLKVDMFRISQGYQVGQFVRYHTITTNGRWQG